MKLIVSASSVNSPSISHCIPVGLALLHLKPHRVLSKELQWFPIMGYCNGAQPRAHRADSAHGDMSSGPWDSTRVWEFGGRRVVTLMGSLGSCTLDQVPDPSMQSWVGVVPGPRAKPSAWGWEGMIAGPWGPISLHGAEKEQCRAPLASPGARLDQGHWLAPHHSSGLSSQMVEHPCASA